MCVCVCVCVCFHPCVHVNLCICKFMFVCTFFKETVKWERRNYHWIEKPKWNIQNEKSTELVGPITEWSYENIIFVPRDSLAEQF